MNKENFDKLSVDHKWTVVKTYLDLIQSTTSHRMGLLPLMSGLAATLLIVATFNEKLIPLDNAVRGIISILLLLIPFSLYFYNEDLKTAQKKAKEQLDILNPKSSDPDVGGIKGCIARWFPDISIYIFGILVIFLVVKIWSY